MDEKIYDYVIIGSGFGGSVSAMRLTEKGYSVLVLEKGKRYEDDDFAKSNWAIWKYLWIPAIRAFGILQISITKGAMVLHGTGVGGGSLGYANVLEVPANETFATPAWNRPVAWGKVLEPHFETAKRMLGVTRNPKLWKADEIMRQQAEERGLGNTFRATEVGVFFGPEGETVPDPYFDGEGPERMGCRHCGGCMVGCRYNSKNTLPKNYLYFAEKQGAEIIAEAEVINVRPWTTDGGRSTVNGLSSETGYEVTYKSSTRWFGGGTLSGTSRQTVRARRVIFSASVMGTMKLLLNLRESSLPKLSPRLGEKVRTNSEALLGSIARKSDINYSEGIAITSIFNADEVTRIEPVRYPDGSSVMRFVSAPLISQGDAVPVRILKSWWWTLRYPLDFLKTMVLSGWAHNTTVILVMQHADNHMKFRLGRGLLTLFRRGLVADPTIDKKIAARVDVGHDITREFAARTNGVTMGSLGENILNLPTTAHILGGAPVGKNADEGVVDENFEIHNYPGLFIVDGSIMPANPGVNPSLTITALAEYAMSKVEEKSK
jgi:cholesterol oxidase